MACWTLASAGAKCESDMSNRDTSPQQGPPAPSEREVQSHSLVVADRGHAQRNPSPSSCYFREESCVGTVIRETLLKPLIPES